MSIFRRKAPSDDAPETRGPAETFEARVDAPAPVPIAETETAAGARARRTSLLNVAAGYSWRVLVVGLAAYVVVQILIKLRLVVLPVIAALFVTALLGPLAQRLKDRGWHPLLATWAVMLTTVALFVGLVAVVTPSVADELDELGARLQEAFDRVVGYLVSSPLNLTKAEIDNYIDQGIEQLQQNRDRITSGLLLGAAKAVEFVAGFFLTIVLVFFFVKDGARMCEWFESQFPERNRRHVRAIGRRAWDSIGGYLRGIAITATVDAILIGIVLLAVGVPLVIPLAMLTFLGAFFPLVGAVVAGAIAALVALVTEGVGDAAIVAAATLVIQQVEGDVLQPVVMGRAVRLHPVVILLSLTAGAIVGGVVGAFLAVPVAAVAATVGNYVRQVNRGAEPGGESTVVETA